MLFADLGKPKPTYNGCVYSRAALQDYTVSPKTMQRKMGNSVTFAHVQKRGVSHLSLYHLWCTANDVRNECTINTLYTAKNKSSILSKMLLNTIVKRDLVDFGVNFTQLQLINGLLHFRLNGLLFNRVIFTQLFLIKIYSILSRSFFTRNEGKIYSFHSE
jgi:hypothetical protein